MVFVYVFKRKKFWGQIDTDEMNKELAKLHDSGVKVMSITPAFDLFGTIRSFTIVLEGV